MLKMRVQQLSLLHVNSVLWLLALLALPSHCAASEIKPAQSQALKLGLVAHAFDISARGGSGQIIFIESSETSFSPHIIGGTGELGALSYAFPATLGELVSGDAPVVISGAYSQRVGGTFVPLGYLRSGGVELSPRPHHSWLLDTIFCVASFRSESAIFSLDDFKNELSISKNYYDCVQTGPRLFKSGKNVGEITEADPEKGRQKYINTSRIHVFVCKADDNPASPLGIAITTDKVTLPVLDGILPDLKIGDRKVCNNAVALSGTISAGMLINGKLVAGSSTFLQSSAIAFVGKGGRPSQKRGSE